MTATTSKNDTSTTVAHDAIALLKADHHEAKTLFASFERADDAAQERIAAEICAALTVHTQIEEEIFYPAARTALGSKSADLLDEALVEHGTAKDLIAKIETTGATPTQIRAWVRVLGEYIQHHVKEEETELFPKLRGSGMDLKAVGAQLATRKDQLTNADAADAGKPHAGDASGASAGARHAKSKSDGAKSPARL